MVARMTNAVTSDPMFLAYVVAHMLRSGGHTNVAIPAKAFERPKCEQKRITIEGAEFPVLTQCDAAVLFIRHDEKTDSYIVHLPEGSYGP